MLKTIMLSQILIANKILAANNVGSVESDNELIKKCGKLSKTRKLFKSQKSAKLGKELSKSGNLPNFDAKKKGLNFLILDTRMTFNCLRVIFTKAWIFWHFDSEYHIWIETNASSNKIGGVLSSLTSKSWLNKIVTNANLGQWHLVIFFSRKIILAKTQ